MKIFIIIIIISASHLKAQQDTIYYNQKTGNYTIQYVNEEGGLIVQTYIPWNKINPSVKCSVEFDNYSSEYKYNWHIKNEADSEQNLRRFIIDIVDTNVTNRSTVRWYFKKLRKLENTGNVHRIRWSGDQGLEPTWDVGGFIIGCPGLPSIGLSYFKGLGGSVLRFSGSPPPDNIMKEFAKIDGFPGSYVLRKTVVPGNSLSQIDPLIIIDTLKYYATESYDLGWIEDEKTFNKVMDKLEEAKGQLADGNTRETVQLLNDLLKDVEKENGIKLTSEAYALLRYNIEYLIKQLTEKNN